MRNREFLLSVNNKFWNTLMSLQRFFGLSDWVAVVRYGVTLLVELKKALENGHRFGVINKDGKLIREITASHMSDK